MIDSMTIAGAWQVPHGSPSNRWPSQRGQLRFIMARVRAGGPRVGARVGGGGPGARAATGSRSRPEPRGGRRAAEADVLAAVQVGLAGDELAGGLGGEVGVER